MITPKDFKFSDNCNINDFAEEYAKLMFGVNWKDNKGVAISHRTQSNTLVSDVKSGWELCVEAVAGIAECMIHCQKHDEYENPAENVPALSRVSAGKISQQQHYSAGVAINPPDGSPSRVVYKSNGMIDESWYVPAPGETYKSVPHSEVVKRMAAAKRVAATKLCNDPQDIIALKPGSFVSSPAYEKSIIAHRSHRA